MISTSWFPSQICLIFDAETVGFQAGSENVTIGPCWLVVSFMGQEFRDMNTIGESFDTIYDVN
jgi:hypothetical protein